MMRSYRVVALGLAMLPMMIAAQTAAPAKATKDAKPKAAVKHNQSKKVKTEQDAAAADDKMTPDPLAQRNSPEPPPPAGSGIAPTTPATNKTTR